MNIVCSGDVYQIYGDGIATYQTLPTQVYEVGFSQMMGFYLVPRSDMAISEGKIYGNYERRVNKVLTGYKAVDRNFGVILSGPKGVGKSLFVKVLSNAAEQMGIPVVIVSAYYPGIAHFIASIEQDMIVLFDEFEKTFARQSDHGPTPQDEMLTLFDGLEGGHKLFVVTCNEVHNLSNYLLNRPGRFHYHFTLDAPTADEITEYLTDKLAPIYHNCIGDVIRFSKMGKMTYDCLRAIAFELNMGYSLEETFNELNLMRDKAKSFDLTVEFNDGAKYVEYGLNDLHLTGRNEKFSRWMYPQYNANDPLYLSLRFSFNLAHIQIDEEGFFVPPEQVEVYYDESDIVDERLHTAVKARIDSGIKSLKLNPVSRISQKYTV